MAINPFGSASTDYSEKQGLRLFQDIKVRPRLHQ